MHPIDNIDGESSAATVDTTEEHYNGIYHGTVEGVTQHRKKTQRLILVRHGETDYNVQKKVQGKAIDAELNENGKHQALLLAERLKEEKVDFVASSPLKRALQTAETVLKHSKWMDSSKTKIHLYDGLQEMGFGPELEGKIFDKESPENVYKKLELVVREWTEGNFSFQLSGGESPLHVESRSKTAIQQILQLLDQENKPITDLPANPENEKPTTFLIVCHGRLLKILLCSLMDIGLENMEKFAQNNTAVNVLEYDDQSKSFTAILLNCTAHLDKPPNN